MSRKRALAVPTRSRTGANPRRPRTPGRVGRAAAAHSTSAAVRPYADRPIIRAVTIAAPLLLAPVLVLATVLVWSLQSAAHKAVTGLYTAIDPRLIIQPRTVAQTAQVDGLRLTLTASPLVPGSNHFEVRLDNQGRPVGGARIRLIATMPGMAGRPLSYQARAIGQGRYQATGPLTMFGRWQILATISRPGVAALTHVFRLSLDVPSGALPASEARLAVSCSSSMSWHHRQYGRPERRSCGPICESPCDSFLVTAPALAQYGAQGSARRRRRRGTSEEGAHRV